MKQGKLEEGVEETKQVLDGLPNGHYVFGLRMHRENIVLQIHN